MKNKIKIYLSLNPGERFSRKILQFPLIKGIRCNTGVPVTESKVNILKNFQNEIYPIKAWVDLKCRELRIIKEALVPHEYLELNHNIEVNTPTALYYNEGKNYVIIDEIIGGNKIAVKPPKNFTGTELIKFGKGASINIPDRSLKIYGYLTQNNKEYIQAAKEIGLHNYFLSYVQSISDINELLELDPEAKIFAKIESQKGLEFVTHEYKRVKKKINLVAARADLYIELDRPHEILNALRLIVQKDPKAIGASLILESFINLQKIPSCTDFTDIGFLMEIGYRSFLLGDDLCQEEESLSSALGVFDIINNNLRG